MYCKLMWDVLVNQFTFNMIHYKSGFSFFVVVVSKNLNLMSHDLDSVETYDLIRLIRRLSSVYIELSSTKK